MVVVVSYQELLHHVLQSFVGQDSQGWSPEFEGLHPAIHSQVIEQQADQRTRHWDDT